MESSISNTNICVVGLGYVGLPLAIAFGKKFNVMGFDVNSERISDLKNHIDKTNEVELDDFKLSKGLKFTESKSEIRSHNFYIVTVPTPIDSNNEPDLSSLKSASKLVGSILKKGDIVIYESTVYPGATEEICLPILQAESSLKINSDFFIGYSPERINPGDKIHTVDKITKVVSGSNKFALKEISNVYSQVVKAGIYNAPSIKVAEAAKVIENTQRDLNIALINELSMIFKRLKIDTYEVLEAANTKWNFLDFKPGLVGGHCIGVDPYYLTHKAQKEGYEPEIILAGRALNDSMAKKVAEEFLLSMKKKLILSSNAKILVLGLTFKENCPDLRNSKVFDLINFINQSGVDIEVYDPLINQDDVEKNSNFTLISKLHENYYDGLILAVSHDEFIKMQAQKIINLCKKTSVICDLKNILPKAFVDHGL